MSYRRRDFIKLASTLASGVALSGVAAKLAGCASSNVISANNQDFGIQLYTLRDDMPKDPKGVLKQLASFGYKQIESYEHDKLGMFWGMKNTEFKKYMDDLGMKLVSSHTDIDKDFEQKAADAAAIGMNYLICPWLGPQKSLDDYKKAAQKFNERGAVCKKNGIGFAYHNHDYSFKPLEGQLPQDLLMKETDQALVDYEMDIYWVVTAGQDPVQWINKYPKRFKLFHIKDRIKNTLSTETNASTTVGTGSIDFPSIIKQANKEGKKFYIVEQERYDGTTPLKAAETGATYMKALNLTA
ncbi:MAG: sugar phosphate isomerase/epimerase [Bacteroidota bacterium]|nr:sugar phosphate isomerase/epimerase [Bacteroidota bacterium]